MKIKTNSRVWSKLTRRIFWPLLVHDWTIFVKYKRKCHCSYFAKKIGSKQSLSGFVSIFLRTVVVSHLCNNRKWNINQLQKPRWENAHNYVMHHTYLFLRRTYYIGVYIIITKLLGPRPTLFSLLPFGICHVFHGPNTKQPIRPIRKNKVYITFLNFRTSLFFSF